MPSLDIFLIIPTPLYVFLTDEKLNLISYFFLLVELSVF